RPPLGRVKVDLSLQFVRPGAGYQAAEALVEDLVTLAGCGREALDHFLAGMHGCFPGVGPEFVSLGFEPEGDHVTLYVRPWMGIP
ncbi:MAG: hypothetical protein HQL82_13535, partial [Magnetococcales bacterium]|nr:hypothetical protein [Magnetococcales bacterium]